MGKIVPEKEAEKSNLENAYKALHKINYLDNIPFRKEAGSQINACIIEESKGLIIYCSGSNIYIQSIDAGVKEKTIIRGTDEVICFCVDAKCEFLYSGDLSEISKWDIKSPLESRPSA